MGTVNDVNDLVGKVENLKSKLWHRTRDVLDMLLTAKKNPNIPSQVEALKLEMILIDMLIQQQSRIDELEKRSIDNIEAKTAPMRMVKEMLTDFNVNEAVDMVYAVTTKAGSTFAACTPHMPRSLRMALSTSIVKMDD